MRNFLFALISIITFISCSTIEDNTPALQGVRDTVLLRTQDSRAIFNEDGDLLIRGERGAEVISFQIKNQAQTQITFGGQNNPSIATYIDENGKVFTTESSQASGLLDFSFNGSSAVTGNFKFTAFTPSFSDTVVFSKGVVYRVPILTPVVIQPEIEDVDDNFEALINTTVFNSIVINHVVSGNVLTVLGRTSSTNIAVSFPLNSNPGTYNIGSNPDFSAAYTTPSGISNAISGEITIIANDQENNIAVGTFSFMTAEGFSITDGSFTINY
ncbi:hypothetical protein JM84_0819 [Dokdonia sp. Hel_I_63]|uniref:DUF6252 family protein n=1 Tax=unclassified Dokdonia TaxID=2615033 RepID=UPI00020A60B7|nr:MULTISPECIES: DUF6252 family protein [unclassified Dokdonia]AEE18833.1 30S ribosomal protein S16 [Dokdonia sp. 4H-3-7-5]TVZ21939.1 hypothetical protein JM84_0819 [Dokdonia sp. Hel_I_63]